LALRGGRLARRGRDVLRVALSCLS
jgi:hypothetical protein